MKIAMACDHGGLRLKNVLKEDLEKNDYEVVDFHFNTSLIFSSLIQP